MAILRYVDPPDLTRLHSICPDIRTVILDVCRREYCRPAHRIDATDTIARSLDYLLLAQEQHKFQPPDDSSPEWQINQILDEWYDNGDQCLKAIACDALIVLQRPTAETRAWIEAVATALMAQGRCEEAKVYYQRLLANGHELPQQTILTAARWGWPFDTIPLPACSDKLLLGRACIGAALGGNTSRLQELLDDDVRPVGPFCLASAAASTGQVEILRLLHERHVDLHADPDHESSPLWYAAKYGQVAAATFLLDHGARPDVPETQSPIDWAMRMGHVEILRLFAPHMQTWTPQSSDGELRIEPAIIWGHALVIQYLVRECGIDINAVDQDGRTMLHLAVEHGQKEVASILIDLELNIDLDYTS